MIDLMERLRNGCIQLKTSNPWGEQVDEIKTDNLLDEAADEIERLASEVESLKKLERDRWTGWAKSIGLRTTPWVAQSTPPTEEGRSFEASYLAIRAAGGDAWDGLDVAKELAEIRGHEAADDEAESK